MKCSLVGSALFVFVSAGCASPTVPTGGCNSAPCAVAGTAVLVAAVATHRAATGDCWGRCGAGLVCDRASGLCIEGECFPRCSGTESCESTPNGLACVPSSAAGFTMTNAPAAATTPAPIANATQPNSSSTTQPALGSGNSLSGSPANPSLPPLVPPQ